MAISLNIANGKDLTIDEAGNVLGGTQTAEDGDPAFIRVIGFRLEPFNRQIDASLAFVTDRWIQTVGTFPVIVDLEGSYRTLLNPVSGWGFIR